MALVWQQPLTYLAPSSPGAPFYYIQYPGSNAASPTFHAFKAMAADTSGLPVPTTGVTVIGDYTTLDAAQTACSNDANPPLSGLIHQDLSDGMPLQPIYP